MDACGSIDKPATLECATLLFQRFVNAAFIFIGILTVILIILAGIRFITAAGDNKQIDGARKMITYAIIGLVVVLMAVAIINTIGLITGVDCIRNFSFTSCK